MTGPAKEYGEALFELARDEHLLEEIHGEVTEIGAILKSEPSFVHLLCSRAIERETRIQVVDDTFAGRAHAYLVNFMKLLVEKERFDCFIDCADWFHQRYNEEFGIVEAVVTSAVPLTDNDRTALRQKLEKISGRQVSLIARVDPSVIGGVKVVCCGNMLDGTLRTRLHGMKDKIKENISI